MLKLSTCWLTGCAALLWACGGDAQSVADAPPPAIDARPQCDPQDPTLWAEEGQQVTVTLQCTTSFQLAATDVIPPPLPPGAVFDPASLTLTWTPGLDQAATWDLPFRIGTTAETARVTIAVADAFDNPANVLVTDPTKHSDEFGMPVMFIPDITSMTDVPITVVYRGKTKQAQGHIRGASSVSYPQQSYTLDFSGDKLDDAANGLDNEKKMVLLSTFDDNSLLRMRLAFEMWNRLQPTVPTTFFPVVVYRAGQYHGVYLFGESIDDELFAQHGLAEDGNLYKAINHNANFATSRPDSSAKPDLADGYEKKHGLPVDDFADLRELVSFVATAPAGDFDAQLSARISVKDYIAWYALAVLARIDDSAGKNSYHHHGAGALFYVVPWDFNASFGQSWETSRNGDDVTEYFGRNNLWQRMKASPVFGPQLTSAIQSAINGPLAATSLVSLWDKWATDIHAAALRNQRKWGQAYLTFGRWAGRTDFTDHDGEVALVRAWLQSHDVKVRAHFGL